MEQLAREEVAETPATIVGELQAAKNVLNMRINELEKKIEVYGATPRAKS